MGDTGADPLVGIDETLLARLRADPKWAALSSEYDTARRQLEQIETQLVADRQIAAQPKPPATIRRPGTLGLPWDTTPNPAYAEWDRAKRNVDKYDDPDLRDEAAYRALETLRKRVTDLKVNLGAQASAVQKAATTARVPHQIQKQEKGPPDENGYQPTYIVTYDVDAQGNEKWNGQPPTRLDLGPSTPPPGREVDLQTAQTNLQIAQQRLAEATSPQARETAQVALEQARATAPVTLATAQTNLATAQQKLAEATSPEARRRAQLDLDTAEVGLERARTLQQRESLPQPFQTGTGRVLTFRDPTTGAITSQENPAYTPPLPQDPVAAYTQEATRYQALARQQRDRLLEQQRQGALTADQAGQQFQQWFADQVEAPLAGLRSAAETARRQEEQQQQALQRAEDQRAEALNRQRASLGYQAGEQARGQLAALAPQLRSPEFLRQQAGMVSAMSQRAAAPSAEAGANVPPAAFTPAAFDPAGYRAAMPDFGAYAKAATERALASISPAVAARIGAPLPQLPTGPALQQLLSGVNYQGPLVRPPSGVQPLPGQEAIDLKTGMARSYYSPTSYLDWPING